MSNNVLVINKDKDFLRGRCDEVVLNVLEKPRVTKIINDLKDTIKCNKDLVALAASQLGHKERIFVIKFSNGDIRAFINPLIIRTGEMHLSRETQVGLDTKEYIVPRSTEIHATYQTPDMTDNCDMNKFMGPVADVFQQMVDLLDGVLLEDFGLEVLPGWDKASDEERQEVLDMYFDNLSKQKQTLEDLLEKNPETKGMSKAIEFMKKLQLGEIETMPLTEEELQQLEEKRKQKENDKNI